MLFLLGPSQTSTVGNHIISTVIMEGERDTEKDMNSVLTQLIAWEDMILSATFEGMRSPGRGLTGLFLCYVPTARGGMR
jgi:hypothetical protein